MSSLAGALVPPDPVYHPSISSPKTEDDLDSIQPSFHFKDDPSEHQDSKDQLNDLFGEDEDVNMVDHDSPKPASPTTSDLPDNDDRLSSPERRHREQLEYAEEDEPEPIIEHRLEADVAIPNIPAPKSSDGNYWVIRMPNFIKLDSKPFHPDTYVGPEHEDQDGQPTESVREKSMSIKLKVENTVRWRWAKDEFGQDRRQSNSRIVRWSDGSLSLQLGKELFDISQSIDTSGAVSRQAFGTSGSSGAISQSQSSQAIPNLSQSQSQSTVAGAGHAQGLTYLVAQHKRAEILQCEAVITGYMSLRPTGMQSETHRMLVRAVGQKHSRVARLRMAPDPTTDPEREKLELAKAAARKPRKSRGGFAGEDDGFGGARRRRASYTRKRTGDDMWSDDEDEDTGFGRGGSEDEYGDDSARRSGGSGAKRKKSGDESGKKGPGEYQTDDFLVADSEEEDDFGDEGASRRKRKRAGRDEAEAEAEEDDLEKLEAKISQNEAEQRKRRQRDGGDKEAGANAEDQGEDEDANAAGEDAMDVESEDDDDDFGVRRGRGSSGRKRRVVGLEEEEEED